MILGMFFLVSNIFAQHILIDGGDETLNMYCPYTKNISFDKEMSQETPAGVIMYLDFDPSKLIFDETNFQFSNLFPAGWIAPILVNWIVGSGSRLSAQRGWINNILPDNWSVGTISFGSKNITWTNLSFHIDWFGFDDQISDTDLYYNNGEDMLSRISWAKYEFIAQPCSPDHLAPTVANFSPAINANTRLVGYGNRTLGPIQSIPEKTYSTDWLNFLVRDGESYTKNQPGYISGNYWSLDLTYYRANTNGPPTFSPINVADRAEWINQNSVRFRFSHMTGVLFDSGNVDTFSWVFLTWQRRTRDFFTNIDSSQIVDYGIEQSITFSGYAEDNTTKSYSFNYLFNQAVPPRLTDLYPNNSANEILPLADIRLRIRDDRAGVDSGTIIVNIFSGSNLIAAFSGTDLHLNPINWDALSQDYEIFIHSGTIRNGEPFNFPIPTDLYQANTITIQIDTQDTENNQTISPYDRYSFETRYSCPSYPWCSDNPLMVYFSSGGTRTGAQYLHQELLVISDGSTTVDTWTQTLDCGNSTGATQLGVYLNGDGFTNPQEYTRDKLYIEWANVIISWNIITVSKP